MKNIKLLILVSVLVAGMLAGCAGGKVVEPTNTAADMPAMETPIVNNAYGGATTEPTTSGPPVIAPPSVSGEGVEVEIEDFTYVPGTITIKVGTTVTWTNKDNVGHTATSEDGVFNSGMLGKNSSYSYTFTTPGTFGYFCEPHPYMVATIVVTE
jgi:plastocyanin